MIRKGRVLPFERSDKIFYWTVIGSFGCCGKETAWNLAAPAMIGHALAALAAARTTFVSASAFPQIFFEIAFHKLPHDTPKRFCHRGHRDQSAAEPQPNALSELKWLKSKQENLNKILRSCTLVIQKRAFKSPPLPKRTRGDFRRNSSFLFLNSRILCVLCVLCG